MSRRFRLVCNKVLAKNTKLETECTLLINPAQATRLSVRHQGPAIFAAPQFFQMDRSIRSYEYSRLKGEAGREAQWN
jgi:hypothetical protein